jgi:hypothetical protein
MDCGLCPVLELNPDTSHIKISFQTTCHLRHVSGFIIDCRPKVVNFPLYFQEFVIRMNLFTLLLYTAFGTITTLHNRKIVSFGMYRFSVMFIFSHIP